MSTAFIPYYWYWCSTGKRPSAGRPPKSGPHSLPRGAFAARYGGVFFPNRWSNMVTLFNHRRYPEWDDVNRRFDEYLHIERIISREYPLFKQIRMLDFGGFTNPWASVKYLLSPIYFWMKFACHLGVLKAKWSRFVGPILFWFLPHFSVSWVTGILKTMGFNTKMV